MEARRGEIRVSGARCEAREPGPQRSGGRRYREAELGLAAQALQRRRIGPSRTSQPARRGAWSEGRPTPQEESQSSACTVLSGGRTEQTARPRQEPPERFRRMVPSSACRRAHRPGAHGTRAATTRRAELRRKATSLRHEGTRVGSV